MPRGRCAGCGFETASAKAMRSHLSACADYIKLWKATPSLALEPEAEFLRHRSAKKSEEALMARDDARTAKAEEYRAIMELKIARQKVRFKSKLQPREVVLLELGDRSDIDLRKAGDAHVDGRYLIDVLADPDASEQDKDRALELLKA